MARETIILRKKIWNPDIKKLVQTHERNEKEKDGPEDQ
jgi:hypothetical protein